MIERVCQQCGKHFLVYPSQSSGKGGKKAIFCSRECQAKAKIGTHQSEETNRKKSVALSRKVEVICQNCEGKFLTKPSVIKRGSGKFCSMKCYAQFKRSQENWNWWRKGKTLPKETRMKISLTQIQNWRDPEYVKQMMLALNKKPTKPEMQLEAILNKHFPQYQYNGDGRLGITLGGLTPDFPNVNGEKDLIEVFGDYYHSPEVLRNRWQGTELGKVMIYNSLGWRCLVIWEHELKGLPEEEIVAKIRIFHRRKHARALRGDYNASNPSTR